MTKRADIDALIAEGRKLTSAYGRYSAYGELVRNLADALESEHKRAEAYLTDPDFDQEHARVVTELRQERERADELGVRLSDYFDPQTVQQIRDDLAQAREVIEKALVIRCTANLSSAEMVYKMFRVLTEYDKQEKS